MVEITIGRPMRASEVLHNALAPQGFGWMRGWRHLCGAVEARLRSRQVVLLELAHQGPDAARVRRR